MGAEQYKSREEWVYESLKSDILDLRLKPGQLLKETEICEKFGVSRTPVRDAFKRLEREGLLEIRPHIGTFVSRIDLHTVSDILYIREVLEFSILSDLAQIYELIIENYKENIAKILNVIADAKEGVILYNCFFGKDRTGILTMLLLSIADVSKEDIIADYQQTYTYVKPYIETHRDILWDSSNEKHYSLPETMENVINRIEEKYGSVADYILSTGVSIETILKIKEKLCGG